MVAQQNLTTEARYLQYQPAGTPPTNKISLLIPAASRAIMGSLNRQSLVSQQYSERYDGLGWGQTRILLRQWPATSVSAMSIGQLSVPAAAAPGPGAPGPRGFLLEPPDTYPPGKMQALDVFHYGITEGRQNVTVTYQAGYVLPQPEAFTPEPSALSYTPLQPLGLWLADNGVAYTTSGLPLTAIAQGLTPAPGQYVPPAPWAASPTTQYLFSSGDEGAGLLASYSFVPSDLEMACIAWIAERVAYASRVGLRGQGLASQETFQYFLGVVPDYVEDILSNYRMVVPL